MWPYALSGFHIGHVYIAKVGNVSEVKAHGLAHEHLEWHFVDGLAARLHMVESIHMRADVIEHAHIFDG